MARARMVFPPDFRWGTATAAYQVEGDNCNSDWWPWEQENGHIWQDHKSAAASNWWENAEADLDRAAEMGTNAHRLSLEWSRIEPEPSVFDDAALDRYRQILQAMHDRGIEPMVTLHHFSNPQWLVEKGDFNTQIVVDYFQRYTARVVTALGDLVPKWVTINEPMVYVFMRYLAGKFPAPRKAGLGPGLEAATTMLRCHAAAYHAIKEQCPEAQVGVAKQMAIFEPRRSHSQLDRWWAGRLAWLFNDSWLASVASGRLRQPFGRGTINHLAGTFDFVGVNYYSRFFVQFPSRAGVLGPEWEAQAVTGNSHQSTVYPEGLYQVIRRVLHFNKPIYITENGVPDHADTLRPAFLLAHLREVWRAVSFCYPVMGYYHWTLVDNFEWDRGWTQRFGLIEIDPETQARRWRPSGHLYSEICYSRSISSEMARRYAPELQATLFPGEAP